MELKIKFKCLSHSSCLVQGMHHGNSNTRMKGLNSTVFLCAVVLCRHKPCVEIPPIQEVLPNAKNILKVGRKIPQTGVSHNEL